MRRVISKSLAIASILVQILTSLNVVKAHPHWAQFATASISPTPRLSSSVVSSTQISIDPCHHHTILNETLLRGKTIDVLTNGWFALRLFGQSARLLTSCPFRSTVYHFCGKRFSGWMKGSHPSIYEGIQPRLICFTQFQCGGCVPATILVKNCGGYYIYKKASSAPRGGLCAIPDRSHSSISLLSSSRAPFTSYSKMIRTTIQPTPTGYPFSTSAVKPSILPSPVPDPCIAHSLLSDTSRYVDGQFTGEACDREFNGWYRFGLNGQDAQMATSPPLKFSKGACGSRFAGYMEGTHPTQLGGLERRSVCFTHSAGQNCSFRGLVTVKKCSSYYVYYLSSVPMCPARYCSEIDNRKARQIFLTEKGVIRSPNGHLGNYENNEHIEYYIRPRHGHYITLEFIFFDLENSYDILQIYKDEGNWQLVHRLTGTRVQFRLVMQGNILLRFTSDNSNTRKGFLIHYAAAKYALTLDCGVRGMTLKRSQVFINSTLIVLLRDAKCNATLSNATLHAASLYSNYTACGTTMNQTSSEIQYQNEAEIYVKQLNGSVVYLFTSSLTCRVKKDLHTVSGGFKLAKHYGDPQEGEGHVSIDFRLYKDKFYIQQYSKWEFPVKVNTQKPLYFMLYGSKISPGSTLVVRRCYMSPSSTRGHGKITDLINNGCPASSSTIILPRLSPYTVRFTTRSFNHLTIRSTNFIHCDVHLCFPNSRENFCSSPCQQTTYSGAPRLKRETGSFSKTTKSYTLSQGPFTTN